MYTRANTCVYTCSAPIWIKTCTSVHIPHIFKYTSVRGNMFNTMCIYIYVCVHIYIYITVTTITNETKASVSH